VTFSPRGGRFWTILAVVFSLGALAVPSVASAAEGPTTLRRTLNEIEEEVMCPVCGTLLGLAESPQATREKAFVEKLVKEGKTKSEIKDELVAQYGNAVLAEPNGSGFSISAYVVPVVAFIVAALLLAAAVWKWRTSAGSREDHDPAVEGPSAEDRKRLDEDLGRYDL
jgi:cytochrome c-type biogenesis protein CcmH/NrfF